MPVSYRVLLPAIALATSLVAGGPAGAQSNPFPSEMRGVMERSGLQPAVRTVLREALVRNRRPISSDIRVDEVSRLMSQMLREGHGDELSRLCLEAVRAGRLETIGEPLATSIAINAVDAALTGAPELVPTLLARIGHAPTLVRMAVQRDYEAIWPLLEARMGLHQQAVLSESVVRERAALAEHPDDSEQLFRLAYALFAAGKYEETVTLVSDWRQRRRRADIDQNLAWAINQQAFALFRLGRREEAVITMDEIANLDDRRRGWVVNFAINRAELLLSSERYEDALEASRVASRMSGSDYARLLIARNRACALERLGRHDEAIRQLPLLRASLAVSLPEAGKGLLCLGQRDIVVAELARLLAEEETARSNYRLLQSGDDAESEDLPRLPGVIDVLAEEPELRALLERWSRTLPEEYRRAG